MGKANMTEQELRNFMNSFYRVVQKMRYHQKAFYAGGKTDPNHGYHYQQSKIYEEQTDQMLQQIIDRMNQNIPTT